MSTEPAACGLHLQRTDFPQRKSTLNAELLVAFRLELGEPSGHLTRVPTRRCSSNLAAGYSPTIDSRVGLNATFGRAKVE
jgi:hypothetical protein